MVIFLSQNCNKDFFRRFLCILLIVIISCSACFYVTEVQAEESLRMYARSYALTDGNTDRLLAGKNETVPMANASTTKILTCIVTLEHCNMNETVTISKNAALQPKVRLGMEEGEQYPLLDMLYGLMLESYNDCAVAIAEHVAGSEEAFSNMMNTKAKEIGCQDTFFLTPNGLDRETESGFHHTTAVDLCKIMAYCVWESPMKDAFLQITQTRQYSGSANGNTYSFSNKNAFLDQMTGALSGKTGYTAKAGYCYVMAYENNGERYCVSLLACGWPNNKTYKWSDTRTLLNYGINNFDVQKIEIEEISEEFQVDGYLDTPKFSSMNQRNALELYGEKVNLEVLLSQNEKIRKELILYKDAKMPIEKGQILGKCNIYVEDVLIETISLVALENSDTWGLSEIIEVILCQFLTFSS